MIFGIFNIAGHSMLPTFIPNDKVLVSKILYYFGIPKKGDIVVFNHNGKSIIKRIIKIKDNKIFVEGDNKKDSLYNLTIEKKDIIGKVIYKL